MIRMILSKSAGHAKAYFSDALSKSDYFISDQELAGRWEGKLAGRLGVTGAKTKESFFALCENINPATGDPLTPRTMEERRVGYDINFHCPKSVSILHALAKDDHILKLFQESVTETMHDIEVDAMTRVRKGGSNEDRKTGELAWGHFVHQTARPVGDFAPDPHLHSHCFVFNATWDSVEQKFKAGQFHNINRDMPYYQSVFHKRLSDKLMTAGYQVRRTAKSFEVDGVPQKVIDLFSKRTDEIGRVAKEKGITDAKELAELGARTRSKKQKGMGMAELKKHWMEQVNSLPLGKGEAEKTVRDVRPKEGLSLTPQQCLDHAVLHCFERASVMPERRLLAAAYRFGLGCPAVSVEGVNNRFERDTRIIRLEERGQAACSTKEVLKEEQRMVDLAKQGKGKIIPVYDKAPVLGLQGQQAAAVKHILTTSNRVSIIRGAAGAGKTTLMQVAVPAFIEAGKEVIIVAPSANASRQVLKEEGFDNANTIARLLLDTQMQQQLRNNVLWVDEAGMLGTKDMLAVLELATKNNAQLILGGDTRQHSAVLRGDALRILNKVANIPTAEVNKIYRQKNEGYRAAVEDLSKGDVKSGFEKLDELGFIQSTDPEKPSKALVDQYIEAAKKGKNTLVVSPVHAQADIITEDIRERLRAEGLIGKRDVAILQYRNLNFTEAQKTDSRNFRQGQVVQFNQHAPGFKRASLWTVDSADDKQVIVRNEAGKTLPLPMDKSQRFDVFAAGELHLSKHDKIRITRGGIDEDNKRLENGQILYVEHVTKAGKIRFRNEADNTTYTIDRDFGHMAHAYCVTSHASQGKTVDIVLIWQTAATFLATNARQFYVSVSRARDWARIYTDDKEELLEHASHLAERTSPIEFVEQEERNPNYIRDIQEAQRRKAMEKAPITKTKRKEDYEPDR